MISRRGLRVPRLLPRIHHIGRVVFGVTRFEQSRCPAVALVQSRLLNAGHRRPPSVPPMPGNKTCPGPPPPASAGNGFPCRGRLTGPTPHVHELCSVLARLRHRALCPGGRATKPEGVKHERTPEPEPMHRDAWPGHGRIETQEESHDDAQAQLLVSTLRSNRRPPRWPGHRIPLVLVPPPVTNLGEVAATVHRPPRAVHNLWLPCPRRRPPAPSQRRPMTTTPSVDLEAVIVGLAVNWSGCRRHPHRRGGSICWP